MGFVDGIWDAVQLIIISGCRWVTDVGVLVARGRLSRVGASRMCRGVAGVGCIVGIWDALYVGRSSGCR